MKKGKNLVMLLLVCAIALRGAVMVSAAAVARTGTEADAIRKLKIIAVNANVDVQLAGNGQYSYSYDRSKFTVTTAKGGQTFKIKVKAKPGAANGWENRVIVYIPKQAYTSITGVAKKSGMSLPAVNANINVINSAGAVSISLPSNYSKTVNYTGVSGSGSLAMNGNTDFAVDAEFSVCAVAVPSRWPAYSNGSSSYSYTSGSGAAKINIKLKGCSFAFVK
ncbi:MAG: hypothetical protein K2N87_19220 [Eubacterium sp.]|nr:hypothetical protein [Eubacterium sp.]